MLDIIYRRYDDSLYHSIGTVGHYDTSKYKKVNAKERYSIRGKNAAPIIGRTARTKNPFGDYASPYYDPVKRQERYLREKAAKGKAPVIEKGKGSSGGKGGGKGSSGGKGGGKGSSGGKGGSSVNLQNMINALKEESQKNTDEKSAEAQKKIEELKRQLAERVAELSSADGEKEGVNIAEIRGHIQTIKDNMSKTGNDFHAWVSDEKIALQKRIDALKAANGK